MPPVMTGSISVKLFLDVINRASDEFVLGHGHLLAQRKKVCCDCLSATMRGHSHWPGLSHVAGEVPCAQWHAQSDGVIEETLSWLL